MVHAINQHGIERTFSDRVWALMPKGKNGWVEYDAQALGGALIPQQVVEFQQSLKKDAVVEESIEPMQVAKEQVVEIPIVIQEETTVVEPHPTIVEKKSPRVKKAHVAKTKKQVKR
jgi:glycerol kinase